MSSSEITVYAKTYVNSDTRYTQNNDQLWHCLKNSLTASGTTNIITNSNKYHIRSNPCGYFLFKIILQKAIVDTRATASNMMENLYSIDNYIATSKYDINKFNKYIKIVYRNISARGERYDDMMSNLLKWYLVAVYKEFVRYREHQKYRY